MALFLNKTTVLSGDSVIDGHLVVKLNANISVKSQGNSYINQSVIDQDKYNLNKKQIRKDIADFQDEVYNIEDAMVEEFKTASVQYKENPFDTGYSTGFITESAKEVHATTEEPKETV